MTDKFDKNKICEGLHGVVVDSYCSTMDGISRPATDKFDDGGPAFPGSQPMNPDGKWDQTWESGMTLWDFFAAHAPNPSLEDVESRQRKGEFLSKIESIASLKADFASAMIAERAKRMKGTSND